MALIKCPECKKKISDQCENCPKCGYPIRIGLKTTEDVPVVAESEAKEGATKPFYKQIWFWIIVGVVIVALAVGSVLLFTRDTQPKYDKNGKPVFVELTNEVYTNAKQYLGYHVQIKGRVFQVMSDDGVHKGIQVWIDPETCEQNIMIYYNTKTNVKQGDYISCTGYIDSVNEYKNAYGATLYAPLLYSDDLETATYIDVMAPTLDSIVPEKLIQEVAGYSLAIEKVEFAKNETRVYVTAKNNGKNSLYVGEAIIVQGEKQYNSTTNYEANYDTIPYEMVKGVSASGIIVFPPMSSDSFKLTIDVHSDDYDEKIDDFVFSISKNGSSSVTTTTTKKPTTTVTKPSYASIVGVFVGPEGTIEFYKDGTMSMKYISFNDDENDYEYDEMTGEWIQTKNEGYCSLVSTEYGTYNPQEFIISEKGIDGFWGDFYSRRTAKAGKLKSEALTEAKKYRLKFSGRIVTQYDLAPYLRALGYDTDEIQYAIDNAEGFYDGRVMDDYERILMFHEQGYSWYAIFDFYSEGWELSYDEIEYLIDECLAGRKLTYAYVDGELTLVERS